MVYLFSCHGGEGKEGENVAWMFASKTGTSVRASTGGVSYAMLFGRYHARMEKENFWNPLVTEWHTYYYGKQYIYWGNVIAKSSGRSNRWAK